MNPRLINQYQGVNPHLQGQLLAYGKWAGFHNAHIVTIAEYLDNRVRAKGYTAEIEPSLQIYYLDDGEEEWRKGHYRIPDIGIQSIDPAMHGLPTTGVKPGTKPTLEQMLSTNEQVELSAISIRAVARDKSGKGQPVAWIELLSPTNKPGGSRYDEYMDKRQADVLGSGNVLVEIDYLHHQAPVSPLIPSYGQAWSYEGQSGVGTPYNVQMEDPRPAGGHRWSLFEFGVEEEMPIVTIPLLKGDKAELELGKAYDETIKRNFAGLINYLEKPLDWETYLPGDQDRIAARIRSVYEGLRNGTIKESNKQKQSLPITGAVKGERYHLDKLLATISQELNQDQSQSLDL